MGNPQLQKIRKSVPKKKWKMLDDVSIANRYTNKARNSKDKGHPFKLTFPQFKTLFKYRYCFYTGIEMTETLSGIEEQISTTRTIDRINNKKGYIKCNVVSCCSEFNQLKGQWEDHKTILNEDHVIKATKKLEDLKNEERNRIQKKKLPKRTKTLYTKTKRRSRPKKSKPMECIIGKPKKDIKRS